MAKLNLEDLRKKTGLTREYVANELKVSSQTVYRWEKGKINPRPLYLQALLKLLKRHFK